MEKKNLTTEQRLDARQSVKTRLEMIESLSDQLIQDGVLIGNHPLMHLGAVLIAISQLEGMTEQFDEWFKQPGDKLVVREMPKPDPNLRAVDLGCICGKCEPKAEPKAPEPDAFLKMNRNLH